VIDFHFPQTYEKTFYASTKEKEGKFHLDLLFLKAEVEVSERCFSSINFWLWKG